jgi:hypothetical protein
MKRTDWLEQGLKPAEARFPMLTAITHHEFSSPIWGIIASWWARLGACRADASAPVGDRRRYS